MDAKKNDILINRYLKGYVGIPIILACKKHGLFKFLSFKQPVTFKDVVKKLQSNSGYLQEVLNMLESLNWICRNAKGEYLLNPESDIHHSIPENIMELMLTPIKEYPGKVNDLKKWMELSGRRWMLGDQKFADFLDGMLLIPMFLGLKESGLINKSDDQTLLLEPDPLTGKEIIEFFIAKDWVYLKDGSAVFNDTGLYIANYIFSRASIAKYRSMLINISEVIFGDSRAVFERNIFDQESYLNRTFNEGTCISKEVYYPELEKTVLAIFNREPFSQQPKYIAEIGCKDGMLLKSIYELIKNKSSRGKVLEMYPIKLIGVDINEKALNKTRDTLKDMDCLVLKGDIGNPEQVITDIKKTGIMDVENILYVHACIDHKRTCIFPKDTSQVIGKSDNLYESFGIDQDGKIIPDAIIMKNLMEHFKRWAAITNKHGLIITEKHCLDPETVNKYIDNCRSGHIDLCHKFSHHLLVEAEEFLIAAAGVGLFPKADSFKKYPQTLPFSQMTFNHFERREYQIRFACKKDLPDLLDLETKCWENGLRTTLSALKKRLQQYPQGTLVLEFDNKVAGVIYSQRIEKIENLKNITMKTVDVLHQKNGEIIQLLTVNISPELQYKSWGDQLLEFMLQICALKSGVEKVIAVTRCKDYYHRQNDITPEEYIRLRNKQGRLIDTILRFHEVHGATVQGLLPGYRPKDKKNLGNGVIVAYDIQNRQRKDIQVVSHRGEIIGIKDSESIKSFVTKTIISILGESGEEDFSMERPLMEMGLDSPDLLDLKEQISCRYQIRLETAFFFKYSTAEHIVAYLQNFVDSVKAENMNPGADAEEAIVSESNTAEQKDKGIAIIGIACRLPGSVSNKDQLWELLMSGKDAIERLPHQRWNWPDYIDLKSKHRGIDFGGFLDDITGFDPYFFRISPKEAELMDPQQRIMLELSWECLEDAGYPAKNVSGSKTGVFIGASGSDYNRLLDQNLEEIEAYYGTGTSMAVLPNRISYFYNFYGPSLQIDTACSSSLVAVHDAVRSLQAGECEQALVGGINIMCHPSTSIAFYKAGMISKDGKCKTFDKEANGYVRGEGAVMLLLKPMEQALTDQDTIYAVIKGTAINHGGQASGLTVPNPEKQAALLVEAFKAANVEPETIGYIEAHGTGTSLGDPVEISGLKEAFAQLTKLVEDARKPYCGLGSIKTNIGHLEAASGIAGLLKVVLCLQYKMIPASLNVNELNPHIALDQTPFYIVNKNQPWSLISGQTLRRAGVSSFGFGGTNAHVVLEESPVLPAQSSRKSSGYLICLSAKTKEALRQKEVDLLNWITDKDSKYLYDISVTLLSGRDHFKIRAAYVVSDVKDIQNKLKQVIEKGLTEGYYTNLDLSIDQNSADSSNLVITILNKIQEEKEFTIEAYRKKLTELAQLYIQGYNFGWKESYMHKQARRISLPMYPFIRRRYWIPENNPMKENSQSFTLMHSAIIHPLLQKNISNISEQHFSSIFTGQEFFLKDHIVQEQKMLPGVAYLEIVYQAVKQASGCHVNNQTIIMLKNVVWARPFVVGDQPLGVHIKLVSDKPGVFTYEIYSHSEANQTPIIHSQGSAVLVELKEHYKLDIQGIKSKCDRYILSAEQCYAAYKAVGISYGPGHQGIDKLYAGTGQALAKLRLPSSVLDTSNQYFLHPSIMDSALQAVIGFTCDPDKNSGTSCKLSLPFELQECQIIGRCTANMWALIQISEAGTKDKAQKVNIDLCDDMGTVCIRMRGFSMRILEGQVQTDHALTTSYDSAHNAPLFKKILLKPIWDSIIVDKGRLFPFSSDQTLLVGDDKHKNEIQHIYSNIGILDIRLNDTIDSIVKKLESYEEIHHILWIAPYNSSEVVSGKMIEKQEEGVLSCFKLIKALLQSGYGAKELAWTVITTQTQTIHKNDIINPIQAGIYGLIGSMAKEYINWKVRLVDLEAGCIWPLAQIFTLPVNTHEHTFVYRGQKWYQQKLVPVKFSYKPQTSWRIGGVYVVIGGAGGIGEVWSEYMIRTYRAQVIWIGRREEDNIIRAKIDRLARLGSRPEYITADATDSDALQRAYTKIKTRYSEIHGVIHSAIVLSDHSLENMREDQFRSALAAKVNASVTMAQVFQKEPLDVVLFFSSILAFSKAAGQSNYASGCSFIDAFAHYLGQQWTCKVKVMNWGYWGGVGVVSSKTYQERMAKAGIGSIEPLEAMEVLDTLVAGSLDQLILVKRARTHAFNEIYERESIIVYPEQIRSNIQSVKKYMLKH